MTEQQPTPGATGEDQGMSTLTKVLIVVGVLIVLGMGGCAACTFMVARIAGNAAEEFAADLDANPAKAAAEMIVRMNPELELVETDDEAETMTIRNVESGQEIVVDFSDVTNGNITFSGEDGDVAVGATEDGITATTEDGEVAFRAEEGRMSATAADGTGTTFGAITAEDVADWVIRYPGAEVTGGALMSGAAGSGSGSFVMTTPDAVSDVVSYYEREMKAAGFQVTVQDTEQGSYGGPGGVVLGRSEQPPRVLNIILNARDDLTEINTQYEARNE